MPYVIKGTIGYYVYAKKVSAALDPTSFDGKPDKAAYFQVRQNPDFGKDKTSDTREKKLLQVLPQNFSLLLF